MNGTGAKPWNGSWTVAALLACAAYIAAYSNNFTLFYYYPMVGEWHWTPQPAALGPGITYFAWKAAGLLGGLLGLLLPGSWTRRIPPAVLWVGALAMVMVVVALEMHWFLR